MPSAKNRVIREVVGRLEEKNKALTALLEDPSPENRQRAIDQLEHVLAQHEADVHRCKRVGLDPPPLGNTRELLARLVSGRP